jgi:hypothetical protein
MVQQMEIVGWLISYIKNIFLVGIFQTTTYLDVPSLLCLYI